MVLAFVPPKPVAPVRLPLPSKITLRPNTPARAFSCALLTASVLAVALATPSSLLLFKVAPPLRLALPVVVKVPPMVVFPVAFSVVVVTPVNVTVSLVAILTVPLLFLVSLTLLPASKVSVPTPVCPSVVAPLVNTDSPPEAWVVFRVIPAVPAGFFSNVPIRVSRAVTRLSKLSDTAYS